MPTLLILVAMLNLGLLCALMIRYQPQTGLPPKNKAYQNPPQDFGYGYAPQQQAAMPQGVNPYANVYAASAPPTMQQQGFSQPVYATPQAPPFQETQTPNLAPLYEEATRQLEEHLDRMERLLKNAETSRRQLENTVARSEASAQQWQEITFQQQSMMQRATPQPAPVAPPIQSASLPTRHGKVRFMNNDAVRAILDLADQGKTPIDIARQLGRGVDEVILTMNLRQMAG